MDHVQNPAILIVDDSIDDFLMIERAFSKLDAGTLQLKHALSGSQALQMMLSGERGRTPCSLVLCDLNMPGHDGLGVLTELRANENTRSLPIVMMSNSCDPHDVARCYAAGANSYIQKPMEYRQLAGVAQTIFTYWFVTSTLPGST